MTEIESAFQSLPPEYRRVVELAQAQHNISITPLQELVGGWSGAAIYLVSVEPADAGPVQHLILKIDRKRRMSSSDEISRHQTVLSKSPQAFASKHIPDMVYEGVEGERAIAIFYAIAGQSLRSFRTLSQQRRQRRLETLFRLTNHYLLDAWNADLTFEQVDHPQKLLKRWLGFRLNEGQKIETFLREECAVHPDLPGFLIEGQVFPNPLLYAREAQRWGGARTGDAIVGLQHGDLNTNNILAKFAEGGDELEGYFLIDFALFKENMPLLYDQRYLEMSTLVHAMSRAPLSSIVELIMHMAAHDMLDDREAPVEMAGIHAGFRAGRTAFAQWVTENHPTLHDDLWGQYWLAGAAAGLSYCHKAGLPTDVRLAGLIFAAANLKRYFTLFGLAMPGEATQLMSKSPSGAMIEGAHKGAHGPGPSKQLPAPTTTFVGRQAELAEVKEHLLRPDVRLVTLTGPGGTGKTRLALEAGRGMQDHFEHGVVFVNLAAVSDPALVGTTVAHAVGIREGGSRSPLENLKGHLVDREMLLLLDNFEQVVEAAPVIADLLSAAPQVKALVTSRITLQVRGEHEYPVTPLRIPQDTDQPPAELVKYEAVALFRQQAQAAQPSFEITEENCEAVVEICRRLDGLPLAIEIAAVRSKMLPPRALLKRLDQSLKLLVGGARDLPDRQQTIRRTIDWSYDLLDAEAQALFTRLGIFAGGFTLEAAEAVCSPSGDIDVFVGTHTLLNSSLLRPMRSSVEEPRFEMLQTVRDYARERADKEGVLEEGRWAHCNYFAELAAGHGMGTGDMDEESMAWLRRFDDEHDNFRVALDWALQHEEGIPLAISMLGALTWYWFRFGHLQAGRDWTERTVAATEGMGESPLRAAALTARAALTMFSGDLALAHERAREAVDICARLGFDLGLYQANLIYGVTLLNQGRDKEAYPHLVESVELADQLHQPGLKGVVLVHLANVSLGLGNAQQALRWLDMALPLMEESGDTWNVAFALTNYGEVARAQGDYEQAEHYYRQTAALFERADARGDQARLVYTLGVVAQHKDNLDKAHALFHESLAEFRELGNQRGVAECLAALAGLATERGKHAWAAPLLGAAESQLKSFGGAWWPADRVEVERTRARLREALGEQFDALWTRGERMTMAQALDYAADDR